jgi:hypothetical protein
MNCNIGLLIALLIWSIFGFCYSIWYQITKKELARKLCLLNAALLPIILVLFLIFKIWEIKQ